MSVRSYDFHGVALEVDCEVEEIGEAIDGRLRHFRVEAPTGKPDLRHEVSVSPEHAFDRPHGAGRPVYDPPVGEVLYFTDSDALWIDVEDRVRVLAEPGVTRVSAIPDAAGDLWLLSRPMFTIPFVERLKRLGLYSVHAAAAARGGRAILLPGASGTGKSTLALALARAGWDFMADDMVFVDSEGSVRAFPDEVDVSTASAAWFPELGLDGVPDPGWPKHRVRIEEWFGCRVAIRATPAALVSPAPGAADASVLSEESADAVLLDLAPNVLLTERESSQAHLDALGALVRSAPAHRLSTGRDFEALPARLAELL